MIGERKFAALVASIYDAATDFRCWPDTLRRMAEAYHAPAVVFGGTSQRVEEMWIIAPQVDPVYNERYAAHFHRINPVWRLAFTSPVGTVLTDTMMISRQDFERTEFFNDFLLPQGLGAMLGAVAHAEPGRQVSIVVQRGREFGPDEVRLHRRLAPHLQRAVQLNFRLARLDMHCAALAEGLDQLDQGAVLVDSASRALLVNHEAERLIGAPGGLRLMAGVLRAYAASDTARLHALVAACAAPGTEGGSGGALLVPRGANRAPLALSILPLRGSALAFFVVPRPVAIIFIQDPERHPLTSGARIRQRYGLTPAETTFALEILKGDGLQACADRLGISLATARTHLSHIFRKTEARRQAELVRLLLQA